MGNNNKNGQERSLIGAILHEKKIAQGPLGDLFFFTCYPSEDIPLATCQGVVRHLQQDFDTGIHLFMSEIHDAEAMSLIVKISFKI